MEILNLLSTGAKNTDIAEQLSLSVHTIKTHIYQGFVKTFGNPLMGTSGAENRGTVFILVYGMEIKV